MAIFVCSLFLAFTYNSATRFVAPITFVGLTALSVETRRKRSTLYCRLKSTTCFMSSLCVDKSRVSEVAWRQRGESWRADPRCQGPTTDHKPKNLVHRPQLQPSLPMIVLHSSSQILYGFKVLKMLPVSCATLPNMAEIQVMLTDRNI